MWCCRRLLHTHDINNPTEITPTSTWASAYATRISNYFSRQLAGSTTSSSTFKGNSLEFCGSIYPKYDQGQSSCRWTPRVFRSTFEETPSLSRAPVWDIPKPLTHMAARFHHAGKLLLIV